MKKILGIILAVCMLLSSFCAYATEAGYEEGYEVQSGENVIYDDTITRTEGSSIVVDNETGREVDLNDLSVAGVHRSMGSFWMDSANVEGEAWAERTPGVTWSYYPAAVMDAAAQMSALSDAMATDPDVLVICPTSGEAVNEAIASAKEKGTIVVGYEGTPDLTNFDYFVDPFPGDVYVKMHVDKIAEMLGDDITYCLWVGRLTTPYQVEWCNTFYNYAAEKYPNMKCILEYGAWLEHTDNEEVAYESAKQVLLSNDVDLLWTPSSGGCLGLARAIEDLGMVGSVYACGQSRPSASKIALDAGTYLFSTIYYPGAVFAAAAEIGRRVWAGEEIKTGDDLGLEGYTDITVDGNWVYGTGWYFMDKDTIDEIVAKYPDF